MESEPEKRWGAFGGLRTDGPSERSPEPTLRNALAESYRILGRLALLAAIAGVAGGIGYLGWGTVGAWYGAVGVVAARVLGEVALRAFAESA